MFENIIVEIDSNQANCNVISQFLKLCNVVFRFSKNVLFEIFFWMVVVNTNDYVWFVTIKDFNPSRLNSLSIMISSIKIFLWFKLNTYFNIKTTTTLNWWSFVPMIVLVAILFPRFNFTFSFRSPCFRHSYNTKTKFQITNECFKVLRFALSEQIFVWNRLKSLVWCRCLLSLWN